MARGGGAGGGRSSRAPRRDGPREPTSAQPAEPRGTPAEALYADWHTLHANRPAVLYQYTTADGLLGMLASGQLWATNSRYMNDPRELHYAIELLRDVVRRHGSTSGEFEQDLLGTLEDYQKNARIFVASFCGHDDLLSQWRGYGAFGGGYAVGLSADTLGDVGRPRPPRYRILRRVIYDPRVQRRVLRDWIRVMTAAAVERSRTHDDATYDAAWEVFRYFLAECFHSFKDRTYAEEHEWRIIQLGREPTKQATINPLRFRAHGGRIVPYVALDVLGGRRRGRLPLTSLRSGPSLDPDLAERSLRLLIESLGYDVEVRRSAIPFAG